MEIIIELPALSSEGRVLFQAYPLTRFMPYPPFAHWPSPSKAQLSTVACLISSFNTPLVLVQPSLSLSLSLSSEDHFLFQAPPTNTLMPFLPYAQHIKPMPRHFYSPMLLMWRASGARRWGSIGMASLVESGVSAFAILICSVPKTQHLLARSS